MNKDELKAMGCTSIEDLITEDFGALGTEERNAFEASCEAFIIGEKLKSERDYDEVIFTAPDGERFCQPMANQLSMKENIIILCGHYKGVDQRVRDHLITKEYTIGDFVLTGGEMPAAIMTDAIVRLLPGAMGDETSALSDSFQDGLLEPGVYTRPAEYKGWKVPEILLSGHQAKIEEWLYEESLRHTRERRPDLLEE